jgi:hypothetical protein
MIPSPDIKHTARRAERGNMLFMILIAVVLIGLLTAAIMSTSTTDGANIDNETLVIRASEVQRTASEFERAVLFIISNRKSEADIRFAHPANHTDYGDLAADTDPSDQVFHANGGGAAYREPPPDIQTAAGGKWEFYGGTAIPRRRHGQSRSDRRAAECHAAILQQDKRAQRPARHPTPEDTGATAAGVGTAGDCLNFGALGRFDGTQQFYDTPNTVDETTFAQDSNTSAARPALQACVKCDIGPDALHFYHVLLAR